MSAIFTTALFGFPFIAVAAAVALAFVALAIGITYRLSLLVICIKQRGLSLRKKGDRVSVISCKGGVDGTRGRRWWALNTDRFLGDGDQ